MYPTSAAYKAAIRKSHQTNFTADVYLGDSKILTLYPVDGEVRVDAKSNVRRMMSLTVAGPRPLVTSQQGSLTYAQLYGEYSTYTSMETAVATYGQLAAAGDTVSVQVDPGLVPDNSADALLPYGNEIRLSRGVEVTVESPYTYNSLFNTYATYSALGAASPTFGQLAAQTAETTEYENIPLGVFVITDVQFEEGDSGIIIRITGVDRSIRVARSKFVDIYQIASGTNAATGLAALLQSRWDDIDLSFADTTATLNATYLGSDTSANPWEDAQGIAQSVGMRLFFDQNGVCRLEPQRDYSNVTPDATYEDGEANVVIDVSRRITVEDTYNAVIVSGEGSGNTSSVFRAEVYDDDPASPTYRYGKFGVVPYFYSSPRIASGAQAAITAEAILQQVRGATEEIAWSSVADPSLDAEDVIKLTNAGTKIDQVLVLDSYVLPLKTAEPMMARARLVRTLVGEGLGA